MKVILLKTGRIINASGGMEKVLFDMANNLSERGYETTVLGFENKIGKPFFHINKNIMIKISITMNFQTAENFCCLTGLRLFL